MRSYLSLWAALASGCAATSPEPQHYQSALGGRSTQSSYSADSSRPLNHAQGMLGVTNLSIDSIDINSNYGSVTNSDSADMPLIGGAFQFPFAGERRIHAGLEGGFTLGFQSNIEAFAFGSNGAVVVADNDVFLTDLFLGAYADIDLGDRFRIYGGVGPTLQFGQIDYDYQDPVLGQVRISEDGFGTGYYGRCGIEFALRPGMAIGAGYRYVNSHIDFSGQIDSMELRQDQYMVTFTESY